MNVVERELKTARGFASCRGDEDCLDEALLELKRLLRIEEFAMNFCKGKGIHRLRALSNEALDFLSMLFTAYEDGPDCYEDPEACSGHIGKAIHIDDESFQRIADILNEHRPRNTPYRPASE